MVVLYRMILALYIILMSLFLDLICIMNNEKFKKLLERDRAKLNILHFFKHNVNKTWTEINLLSINWFSGT